MKIETPAQLLLDQMRDLMSVETQLIPEWPGWSGESTAHELKALLSEQGPAAKLRHDTLVELFKRRDIEPGNDKSKAMEGLIEGGNAHIEMAGPAVKDLILIAHVGRVLAYSYAGYGFATALAASAGFGPEADYLGEAFQEINDSLSTLTSLGRQLLIAEKVVAE